ncbi:uncharacterized protein in vnfD 5'region-like [Planococcus citri]|uniref:uncharacterized protein in vnfD 5'region-like n=1 Tax=Planococcus citri TaxID=170843 RepID=UPI0031F80CAC
MLFKVSIKKHSSLSFAVTAVLFLQYVGSQSTNPLPPPQEQNNKRIHLPTPDIDWEMIRNPNVTYLYVDKTQYLWKLVINEKARRRFIGRYRRFGKSMFLQMAEQFFRGNEVLFKGLFIEKHGNKNLFPTEQPSDVEGKWMKYPVINLNFKTMEEFTTIEDFKKDYYKRIETIAREYEVHDFEPGHGSTMQLIELLYFKFNRTPVIVLVDEYDSPYEYALSQNNANLAKQIRNYLDNLFGMMKNDVRRVGFLFIMGISKLVMGVFQSGANNIVDETYNPEYAEAFGFTEEEITEHLGLYIDEFAKNVSLTRKNIMDSLKHWYDGYQFDPNNRSRRVFNPVSTFSSIRNKRFDCYWIKTSSMDPIPEMFYEEGWSLDRLLKGTVISSSLIMDGLTEREKPTLIRWMFYNGYYTLDGQDFPNIKLKIPNTEIETAINKTLLSYDPTAQKPYKELCLSQLLMFKVHLESENIQEAISILRKIGFPAYSHPLTQKIESFEVERRLDMLFEIAGIKHQSGFIFKKADGGKDDGGDIEIWTEDLAINYVIETKTTPGTNGESRALHGIEQLLNYTRNYRDSLMIKLSHPEKIFFLSWAFELREGCANLTSWIFLPVYNGEPDLDNFQASSDGVERRFEDFKKEWLPK